MNVNEAYDESGSWKYYKILINIEVIMYVTYHLKTFFVILKWDFNLFCSIYNILVNSFYFHKYSHKFKLIKHDWM